MRITAAVIDAEVTVRGLFTDTPSWSVWTDDRTKRRPDTPNLIAAHHPDGTVLAVHVRPRRLYPSELPATRPAPAGALVVVWHPDMSSAIRQWLRSPAGAPPGLIDPPSER
jgi:hypothetical protein